MRKSVLIPKWIPREELEVFQIYWSLFLVYAEVYLCDRRRR